MPLQMFYIMVDQVQALDWKRSRGMFFTIEPMVNLGRPETKLLSDGWTAATRDRASCQLNLNTLVGVTKDGCEIFTLSPENRFHPTY